MNKSVKIFGWLRSLIAPFDEIIRCIPDNSTVLDIGCGYGFLANEIASRRKNCFIHGIDMDSARVRVAKALVAGKKNVEVTVGDVSRNVLGEKKFDVVICFDILHHISREAQESVLKDIHSILNGGGTLLLKEIDVKPKLKYWWNYVHDTFVTRGGSLFFRSTKEWVELIDRYGLKTERVSFPKKGVFYPHVFIVASKKADR